MLDIKFIRENAEKIKETCANRGVKLDIDRILDLDGEKRENMKKIEEISAEKNKATKIIPGLKDENEKNKIIADMKKIDEQGDELKEILKKIDLELNDLLCKIPNLCNVEVPIGEDETKNVVLKHVAKKPNFRFKPKDYMEIAEKLDLIDTQRAAKVSGSRFGYIKGELALLEMALVKLAFDVLRKNGFVPIIPSVMIKPEMMKAMGYIDSEKDIAERYFLEKDNLFLVGTAEQSVGPMHSEETFNEKDLPKRYVAFSTCFREEAGSYGKDTKGILRVHQFDKVEMFSFCKPEDSDKEHKLLVAMQEKLMGMLKISYQVVQLCTGDLARPSASTIDIESWFPGQNQFRETHSASNCTDFQARRLNIRYKDKTGKMKFVHTLNGTAFAIGRTLIAIIENCQQKDGSVKIPWALRKYAGFSAIKQK